MTQEDFVKVDAVLLATSNEVLIQRGGAYATDGDRLDNFKKIAAQAGVTPMTVCFIFLLKGIAVLEKFSQGKKVPGETVAERFSDALNYVRLLHALYLEMNGLDKPTLQDLSVACGYAGCQRMCFDEPTRLVHRLNYHGIGNTKPRVPGAKCATPGCPDTSVGGPLCNQCTFGHAKVTPRSFE